VASIARYGEAPAAHVAPWLDEPEPQCQPGMAAVFLKNASTWRRFNWPRIPYSDLMIEVTPAAQFALSLTGPRL
jgi:hypothetical protein